jgi:hypothetical protein
LFDPQRHRVRCASGEVTLLRFVVALRQRVDEVDEPVVGARLAKVGPVGGALLDGVVEEGGGGTA